VPVPVPRICTRARGTRVPETGTCMKRVGYSFEKKSSTCARPTRLPAAPVLALSAARRGCARPVPAVPVSNSLMDTSGERGNVHYRFANGLIRSGSNPGGPRVGTVHGPERFTRVGHGSIWSDPVHGSARDGSTRSDFG
jgi:hypothetical protein